MQCSLKVKNVVLVDLDVNATCFIRSRLPQTYF